MLNFVIIANPENRRVGFLQQALTHFNLPPATVKSYADLIAEKDTLERFNSLNTIIRFDSPERNFDIDKAIITAGAEVIDDGQHQRISAADAARLEFDKGLILYPRQWYLGWRNLLQKWEKQLQCQTMNHPQDIAVMFDKPRCCGVFLRHNIPCNKDKLALWATFHPEWVKGEFFLTKCLELDRRGVRFSAGVVGFPQFKDAIATLRQELPPHIYLWINAVKKELANLSTEDRNFFAKVDPLFHLNTQNYPSLGHSCRAGKSVISVDGDGNMRRCHFIKESIGNIYDRNFELGLVERPCTNTSCHCHIGYVHLDYLELNKVFGSGILERIPDQLQGNAIAHQ